MKTFLRIYSVLAVLLLFMISQLNAQTILCVDRDFGDTSGTYSDTWPMISSALNIAGYTYDYYEVMDPADNGPDATVMGEYDVVIWFTGEAWTGGETMGPDDEFNLLLFMSVGGGKLFLNAQDYLYDWYTSYGTFSEGEFPYDQLGVVEVIQDVYHIEPEDPSAIADSAQFIGAPGSLAEGMEFSVYDIFTSPTDDGLYGDSIAQYLGDPLLSIQMPYVSAGPAAVQYETPYFRSVFSTIDIASVKDTMVRGIFMNKIVDWLMYGATGLSEMTPSDVNMLIKPNPVSDFVEIGMIQIMDEIMIYNNQGQMVRHENTNSSNIKLNLGDLPAGLYILKARTGNNVVTNKILKL